MKLKISLLALFFAAASTSPGRAGTSQEIDSAPIQEKAGRIVDDARSLDGSADQADEDGKTEKASPDGEQNLPRRFLPVPGLPGIFRSARPDRRNLAKMKEFGIKTILDLEGKRVGKHERDAAANLGIKVESFPLSSYHAPSFEQLDQVLDILDKAPRPVVVHCRHGEDRTGVVVAALEVVEGHKTPAAAAQEAQELRCCHFVLKDLKGFLTEYQAHRAGSQTGP